MSLSFLHGMLYADRIADAQWWDELMVALLVTSLRLEIALIKLIFFCFPLMFRVYSFIVLIVPLYVFTGG